MVENQATEGLLLKTRAVANDIEISNQEMESVVETLGAFMKSTFDYDAYVESGDVTEHAELMGAAIRDTVAHVGRDLSGIYVEYDVDYFDYNYDPWFILRDGVPTQEVTEEGSYSFDPEDPDMIWYFAPIETGHGVWTGVYEDTDIDVIMYSYVAPIFTDDGQLIGVAGMDVDLKEVQETVRAVKIYTSGYSFLLDDTGAFIVAPREALDETIITELAEMRAEGVITRGDMLISYIRLTNGQLLVTVADRAIVLAPVYSLRNELLLFSLIAAIIVCLVGYLVVSGMTKRIKQVTAAAKMITDGNFDIALPKSKARDEISELSAAMEMLVSAFKLKTKKK